MVVANFRTKPIFSERVGVFYAKIRWHYQMGANLGRFCRQFSPGSGIRDYNFNLQADGTFLPYDQYYNSNALLDLRRSITVFQHLKIAMF